MKNMNKLEINSGKLLRNEELLNLRGGINCVCTNSSEEIVMTGSAQNTEECNDMCSVYDAGGHFLP